MDNLIPIFCDDCTCLVGYTDNKEGIKAKMFCVDCESGENDPIEE